MNFATLRAIAISGQFLLIYIWGRSSITDNSTFSTDWIFLQTGFVLQCFVMFCAGVLTTAVFTLMMRLSQTAPEKMKGTHFTTLATFEVSGKLIFAAISGYLIDTFGLETLYLTFVIFAFITVPFVKTIPVSILNSHNERELKTR